MSSKHRSSSNRRRPEKRVGESIALEQAGLRIVAHHVRLSQTQPRVLCGPRERRFTRYSHLHGSGRYGPGTRREGAWQKPQIMGARTEEGDHGTIRAASREHRQNVCRLGHAGCHAEMRSFAETELCPRARDSEGPGPSCQ